MANTRFFIKTVDPENPCKEKVVWGSSLMGSDPNDETEADCGVWDGLMYISESNEEWGDCTGDQKVYFGGKAVKLGLDVCDVGEADKVKTRIAYSANRGKLLEDQVIALAKIVANLSGYVSDHTTIHLDASTQAAANAVAQAILNLQ